MRILHTADWHLGKTMEGRDRMNEFEAMVDEIVRAAEDYQVEAIVLAGDVFDAYNPPAAAERLYYDALDRLSAGGKRKMAVIAGNHDQPERLAAPSPLLQRFGVDVFSSPLPTALTWTFPNRQESAVILAMPYPSEARLRQKLSDDADESQLRDDYAGWLAGQLRQAADAFGKDTCNLLISHLFVAGGRETQSERPIQLGGAYTVPQAALQCGADYAALGHLHRPQQWIGNDQITRYAGSPLSLSFSEAGQAKSVSILNMKPGVIPEVEVVHLNCGKPLVRWQAAGGLQQVQQWLDEGRDPEAWIELEIHVEQPLGMEELRQLRLARPGLVHVRPILPERILKPHHRLSSASIEELFVKFFERQTNGGKPDPEVLRLFNELLTEVTEEQNT